jgi:hypothetical protein
VNFTLPTRRVNAETMLQVLQHSRDIVTGAAQRAV